MAVKMADINVDDFFKDAARTLAALYGVFPRRHAIFVEDIYAPEEPDEFGMHSDRHRACFGKAIEVVVHFFYLGHFSRGEPVLGLPLLRFEFGLELGKLIINFF